jgi:transcriptional regulator NrdR family protein
MKKTKGIRCPQCGMLGSHVIRSAPENGYVTRRRECGACHFRYTTSERIVGKIPADMGVNAISVGQLRQMLDFAIGKAN